jgi:hypothetical protein
MELSLLQLKATKPGYILYLAMKNMKNDGNTKPIYYANKYNAIKYMGEILCLLTSEKLMEEYFS